MVILLSCLLLSSHGLGSVYQEAQHGDITFTHTFQMIEDTLAVPVLQQHSIVETQPTRLGFSFRRSPNSSVTLLVNVTNINFTAIYREPDTLKVANDNAYYRNTGGLPSEVTQRCQYPVPFKYNIAQSSEMLRAAVKLSTVYYDPACCASTCLDSCSTFPSATNQAVCLQGVQQAAHQANCTSLTISAGGTCNRATLLREDFWNCTRTKCPQCNATNCDSDCKNGISGPCVRKNGNASKAEADCRDLNIKVSQCEIPVRPCKATQCPSWANATILTLVPDVRPTKDSMRCHVAYAPTGSLYEVRVTLLYNQRLLGTKSRVVQVDSLSTHLAGVTVIDSALTITHSMRGQMVNSYNVRLSDGNWSARPYNGPTSYALLNTQSWSKYSNLPLPLDPMNPTVLCRPTLSESSIMPAVVNENVPTPQPFEVEPGVKQSEFLFTPRQVGMDVTLESDSHVWALFYPAVVVNKLDLIPIGVLDNDMIVITTNGSVSDTAGLRWLTFGLMLDGNYLTRYDVLHDCAKSQYFTAQFSVPIARVWESNTTNTNDGNSSAWVFSRFLVIVEDSNGAYSLGVFQEAPVPYLAPLEMPQHPDRFPSELIVLFAIALFFPLLLWILFSRIPTDDKCWGPCKREGEIQPGCCCFYRNRRTAPRESKDGGVSELGLAVLEENEEKETERRKSRNWRLLGMTVPIVVSRVLRAYIVSFTFLIALFTKINSVPLSMIMVTFPANYNSTNNTIHNESTKLVVLEAQVVAEQNQRYQVIDNDCLGSVTQLEADARTQMNQVQQQNDQRNGVQCDTTPLNTELQRMAGIVQERYNAQLVSSANGVIDQLRSANTELQEQKAQLEQNVQDMQAAANMMKKAADFACPLIGIFKSCPSYPSVPQVDPQPVVPPPTDDSVQNPQVATVPPMQQSPSTPQPPQQDQLAPVVFSNIFPPPPSVNINLPDVHFNIAAKLPELFVSLATVYLLADIIRWTLYFKKTVQETYTLWSGEVVTKVGVVIAKRRKDGTIQYCMKEEKKPDYAGRMAACREACQPRVLAANCSLFCNALPALAFVGLTLAVVLITVGVIVTPGILEAVPMDTVAMTPLYAQLVATNERMSLNAYHLNSQIADMNRQAQTRLYNLETTLANFNTTQASDAQTQSAKYTTLSQQIEEYSAQQNISDSLSVIKPECKSIQPDYATIYVDRNPQQCNPIPIFANQSTLSINVIRQRAATTYINLILAIREVVLSAIYFLCALLAFLVLHRVTETAIHDCLRSRKKVFYQYSISGIIGCPELRNGDTSKSLQNLKKAATEDGACDADRDEEETDQFAERAISQTTLRPGKVPGLVDELKRVLAARNVRLSALRSHDKENDSHQVVPVTVTKHFPEDTELVAIKMGRRP